MAATDRLQTIAQARQALLHDRNGHPVPALAPWLQRGWQRCQSWGLEPAQQVGFDPISAARMRRVQEENRPLVQAARPVLAVLALAAALGVALSPLRHALQEPTAVNAGTSERWSAWSPAEVSARQAQGQTVFVDFTAAWCVTCQYNKKTVFSRQDVLAAFDAKNVRTMRADWTRRDTAITQALSQLGRSGVPVYAIYTPGRPPVLLSELPSVGEVLSALP